STAGEAGQIFRPVPNSDHGIDGEIEFKNDNGEASGRKIYLQLKSGDSYLYRRESDGSEIFTAKKERHLRYWQDQAYPVYLVVRSPDSSTRWMNVTEYLRNRIDKTSLQIIFNGEPFTAYTLLKLANLVMS